LFYSIKVANGGVNEMKIPLTPTLKKFIPFCPQSELQQFRAASGGDS
jgi:hypothetical protein